MLSNMANNHTDLRPTTRVIANARNVATEDPVYQQLEPTHKTRTTNYCTVIIIIIVYKVYTRHDCNNPQENVQNEKTHQSIVYMHYNAMLKSTTINSRNKNIPDILLILEPASSHELNP